jgi:hypothetical protein
MFRTRSASGPAELGTWVILSGLLAPSCALCPTATVESPEGIVHASSREMALEAVEALHMYSALVSSLLGTRQHPVEVDVDLWRPFDLDFRAYRNPERIVVRDPQDIEELVVHELVHEYSDGRSALPFTVEEGLAQALQHTLTTSIGVDIPPPDPAWIQTALVAKNHEVIFGSEEFKASMIHAALWIASKVGIRGLTALVDRATFEGLEEVPAEWIAAALPPTSEPGTIDVTWPGVQLTQVQFRDGAGNPVGTPVIAVLSPAGFPWPEFPPGATTFETRRWPLFAHGRIKPGGTPTIGR